MYWIDVRTKDLMMLKGTVIENIYLNRLDYDYCVGKKWEGKNKQIREAYRSSSSSSFVEFVSCWIQQAFIYSSKADGQSICIQWNNGWIWSLLASLDRTSKPNQIKDEYFPLSFFPHSFIIILLWAYILFVSPSFLGCCCCCFLSLRLNVTLELLGLTTIYLHFATTII